MEVQQFGDSWKKIKDDPVALEQVLLTDATIHCSNGQIFQGVIQSVDTVTKSIILVRVESNKVKDMTLCVGDQITEIITSPHKSKFASLVDQLFVPAKKLTASEIEERQKRLVEHLEARNLPCSVDGPIVRLSTWAHIEPPYTKNELFCTNEIIQERVSSVLDEFA